METSTAKSAAEEALSGAERGPESPRIEATWPQAINPQPGNPQPERRRLVRNLRSSALFAKIREAERRMELVRVAKALELLPLTDEAFNRGELFWTAVRVMTRVATPQT